MWNSLYKYNRKIQDVKECWLYEPLSEYLNYLLSRDYSKTTLRSTTKLLIHFASFSKQHGMQRLSALPEIVDLFVECYDGASLRQNIRCRLQVFIRYMRSKGRIPPPRKPVLPFARIVAKYETFVRERQSLTEKTLRDIISCCQKFLLFAYDTGISKLKSLNQKAVCDFITYEGQIYSGSSILNICSSLRHFLTYLYAKHKTRVDLSAVIVTPRVYRPMRIPRVLTRKEIKILLSSIDRRGILGKRNYALLMLLATYGLRGIEAVRLRLEDIDWRKDKIYIRFRKAKNNSVYPLTPAVGDAILSYLKRGRPKTEHREVFLSYKPPYRPINTDSVYCIVKKYLRIAGLPEAHVGAHTFRHSCAQQLLEKGFPLKTVSDYLGHKHPNTTRQYIRIDIKHLREVALNRGEELL